MEEHDFTPITTEKIKNVFIVVVIGLVALLIILGVTDVVTKTPTVKDSTTLEFADANFGGPLPMKIYQVYDKDTGVYYAVTANGGICVMETMDGSTKLVDEGDGVIIHHNMGRNA